MCSYVLAIRATLSSTSGGKSRREVTFCFRRKVAAISCLYENKLRSNPSKFVAWEMCWVMWYVFGSAEKVVSSEMVLTVAPLLLRVEAWMTDGGAEEVEGK